MMTTVLYWSVFRLTIMIIIGHVFSGLPRLRFSSVATRPGERMYYSN